MTEPTDISAATRAELLDVEDRRRQALVDGAVDELEAMLDDDLVHIHAPGVVHNKAQLLEHLATRRPYLSIDRGALDVRLVGDVAILTGPITNRLRTAGGGERTLSGIATQVLRRDADGEWRFLSFQMTPIAEQAWPNLPSQEAVAAVNSAGAPDDSYREEDR